MSQALALYKSLLKAACKLPEAQRVKVCGDVRRAFRESKEVNPDEVSKLLEKAASTLGYLKIITPRGRQVAQSEGARASEGGRKATSNWSGKNLDPDSVRRHQSILKRAGFRSNREAKGTF